MGARSLTQKEARDRSSKRCGSFGYSAETVIADISDNSLSADATAIHVKYDASDVPFVAILDDGRKMCPAELAAAKRHGSGNPTDRREAKDLGRLGLGLKTASLSQRKKLTVISKKDVVISARCWDLDVIQDQRKWPHQTAPP